jgi:16S rRNA processing protein RimM
LVEIGKGMGPHGIHGAIAFDLFSGPDTILDIGHEVFLRPFTSKSSLLPEGQFFKLEKIVKGHKILANLAGVKTPEAVKAMMPFSIWLDRSTWPSLSSNAKGISDSESEYYLVDLIGLDVIGCSDDLVELGQVGIVADFYSNGVQEVLVIDKVKGEAGSDPSEKVEPLELPLVKHFFPKILFEENKIYLRQPSFIGEEIEEEED